MEPKQKRHFKTSAIILAVAVVIASLLTFIPIYRSNKAAAVVTPEPTSKVTVVPARPSTEPTPTPEIKSITLYAFGGELPADGFTMYVGDKAITLTAVVEPKMDRPPVSWSFSNPNAVRMGIGDDRLSCELTALKPSGKNELTVSCYGTELVLPVFLWER